MRYIYTLFKLLLYNSIIASILALIIILIKTLFKNKFSAAWNYYIWLLVFIRLILPYSFNSSLSINNLISFSKPASIIKQSALNNKITVNTNQNAAMNLSRSDKLNTNYNTVTAANSKASFKTGNLYSYKNIICILWFLGIGIASCYIVFPYIAFKIKIEKEPSISNDYNDAILNQCKQILKSKSSLPLIYSNKVNVPSLIGIIKPSIVIPHNMIKNLTPEEIKYIFIHELVHYKRKDNLLFLIITLTLVVYWFNPILWLCFKFMKKDCELSCDFVVLSYLNPKEHKLYGVTLIKLTEYTNINKTLLGTSAIISNKNIKRRIIMISKFKKKSLLWVILATSLTVIIGITGLTNSKTIAKKNTRNNTNTVTKTNDNENIQNNISVSIKRDTITNDEFKNLVINSYNTVTQINKLRENSYFQYADGSYYYHFKKDITDYDSLYKYFDEELSLSKYFSKDFNNRLIKRITKEINGHYYMLVGDFGIGIKDAKLISQKYEDNKLIVTFQCRFNDGDAVNFNGAIIYDSNWKFDKVDLWGFKFKDN